MRIKQISVIFQVILWLLTLILTLTWLFVKDPPFEPEPLIVISGLVASGTSAILRKYREKIEVEEFCISNALAFGYVNNFLEPAITQLMKDNVVPKFYIFMPEKLSDLLPKSIDRYVASLQQENLLGKPITIESQEGRGARDIISISNAEGRNIYFDFPNTLLTIVPLIEYKLESGKSSFNNEEKEEYGALYISRFKETVRELLIQKRLFPDAVSFTESIKGVDF